MNLQQLLVMVDDLSPDDRERLKAYLMESQAVHWNSGKEWLTLLDTALEDFWADMTPEERTEILVAIQANN